MVRLLLALLFLGVSTLALPLDFEGPPAPEEDAFVDRPRRSPGNGYSTGTFSGSGAGVYNGYGGGYGPVGYFTGYAGNYGPYVPNFYAMPYAAPQAPFDLNNLFNNYFNALQNYQLSVQNQFQNQFAQNFGDDVTTRQISVGAGGSAGAGGGLLPQLPGNGQLAQLASNARQQLQRALCQALQRLQVQWAQTASVCSGQAGAFNNGGIFAVASGAGTPSSGVQVAVSAPPGATVQQFQGPGGLQGVSVTQETSNPGLGNGLGLYGAFSSSSSSSSNINGVTDSHHSSTSGVNNNGQVTSVTVTKP